MTWSQVPASEDFSSLDLVTTSWAIDIIVSNLTLRDVQVLVLQLKLISVVDAGLEKQVKLAHWYV